ncbi:MAG: hypothetical protein L0H73_02510 [Nitrococcus sp.]|nr:hypothetical protein [Nitrococcus sp.]
MNSVKARLAIGESAAVARSCGRCTAILSSAGNAALEQPLAKGQSVGQPLISDELLAWFEKQLP